LTRGPLGWTTDEFYEVKGPVHAIWATNPGLFGVSQMFVLDGNNHVTNLWIAGDGKTWIPRDLPDLPGGTVDLTFDYRQTGMQTVAVNQAGVLYKFVQDTLGRWSGDVWATMPAGPLDMAPSADPTMKDVAVFYSAADGIFRYLFADHKTDEVARIPIAAGTTHMLGKSDQLRFNEFFGMNGGEFCLFEFNFDERRWDRLPQKKISSPVVSVEYGPARGGHLNQILVATVNGEINEFTRQELKEAPPDSVEYSPGE